MRPKRYRLDIPVPLAISKTIFAIQLGWCFDFEGMGAWSVRRNHRIVEKLRVAGCVVTNFIPIAMPYSILPCDVSHCC